MLYRKEPEMEPWWNNPDKLSGLLTTIIMLTVVVGICVLGLALLTRWAF